MNRNNLGPNVTEANDSKGESDEESLRKAFVEDQLKHYTRVSEIRYAKIGNRDPSSALTSLTRHLLAEQEVTKDCVLMCPRRCTAEVTTSTDGSSSEDEGAYSIGEYLSNIPDPQDAEKGLRVIYPSHEAESAATTDEDEESTVPAQSDCSRHVWVPMAGCRQDAIRPNERHESGTCAICLSAFQPGEKLSWSSNPACPHLFHRSCIQDWLLAVGRKQCRQRRGKVQSSSVAFPMLCPCCRRPFVLPTSRCADDTREDVESPSSVHVSSIGP